MKDINDKDILLDNYLDFYQLQRKYLKLKTLLTKNKKKHLKQKINEINKYF